MSKDPAPYRVRKRPGPMSDDEYARTQTALLTCAGELAELDLEGFRERISSAQSAGAVIDPTLYRQAHRTLDAIDRLAADAHSLACSFRALRQVKLAEMASLEA